MAVSEYVGTKEAAELLKVEVPRITRWRKAGKMPPTAIRAPRLTEDGEEQDLASTPVWRRKDVLRLARTNGKRWEGERVEKKVGCGTSEAATEIGEILGRHVDKSQIGRWRRAGTFPDPWFVLGAGPVWTLEAIESYARERREEIEEAERAAATTAA